MPNTKNGPTPKNNGDVGQLEGRRGILIGSTSYAINERNDVPPQRPPGSSNAAREAFGLK